MKEAQQRLTNERLRAFEIHWHGMKNDPYLPSHPDGLLVIQMARESLVLATLNRELMEALRRYQIMYKREHGTVFPTHIEFSLRDWRAVEAVLAKAKEQL